MVSDTEHVFTCLRLLAVCVPPLEQCLSKAFALEMVVFVSSFRSHVFWIQVPHQVIAEVFSAVCAVFSPSRWRPLKHRCSDAAQFPLCYFIFGSLCFGII